MCSEQFRSRLSTATGLYEDTSDSPAVDQVEDMHQVDTHISQRNLEQKVTEQSFFIFHI